MQPIKLCLVGLVAAFNLIASAALSEETPTTTVFCQGAECNEQDPIEAGCDVDAFVVTEMTTTLSRWQDSWQPKEIIIQNMHSELCQASWARAYVPDETFLFVRTHDMTAGLMSAHGLVKATGSEYFWANSNMTNGDAPNQACVALSTGLWFWFDRYCTEVYQGEEPQVMQTTPP